MTRSQSPGASSHRPVPDDEPIEIIAHALLLINAGTPLRSMCRELRDSMRSLARPMLCKRTQRG